MYSKEKLEHAFKAGRISENTSFEEWYDTFCQNTKSICPNCKFEPMINVNEKYHCEMCGYNEIQPASDAIEFAEFIWLNAMPGHEKGSWGMEVECDGTPGIRTTKQLYEIFKQKNQC